MEEKLRKGRIQQCIFEIQMLVPKPIWLKILINKSIVLVSSGYLCSIIDFPQVAG